MIAETEAVDETGESVEEVEELPSETLNEFEEDEEIPEEEEAPESDEEDEAEEEEPEPPVEEHEFTFGNEKLSVPKSAIPDEVAEKLNSFSKGVWSDYTKKSQAIAEQTKSLEAQAEAVQTLGNLNGEAMSVYSKVIALESELAEYQNPQIDWDSMYRDDPDAYRLHSDKRARLEGDLNRTRGQLNQHVQSLNQAKGSERERFMAEGRKAIEQRIKGFGAKEQEVKDYLINEAGVPADKVEDWPLNPVGMEMAYKAMLYDSMQKKMKSSGKALPKKASTVPASKIKGGKPAAKNPAKMSMNEYAKYADSMEKAGHWG